MGQESGPTPPLADPRDAGVHESRAASEVSAAGKSLVNGSEGEMWITPEGSLCELILPTSNMRFELVSAAEAETEIAAARKAAHLTQKKK